MKIWPFGVAIALLLFGNLLHIDAVEPDSSPTVQLPEKKLPWPLPEIEIDE